MTNRSLRIAQIMGYHANKIGALETFSIRFAELATNSGHRVHFVYSLPPISTFVSALEDAGAEVVFHPIRRRLDFRFSIWLWRWLRKRNIDIIDCHFDLVNLMGTVVGFLAEVPYRFWHQRNFVNPRLVWLKRWIYKRFNLITNGIICSSPPLARDMISKGIHKDLVYAIPTGIDFSRFDGLDTIRSKMRESLNLPSDVPIVVMVSQARIEKGCIHLIRASRPIHEAYPKVRFIHVGGGPLESELKAETERLGVAKCWQWLGERSDVPKILGVADLLVLPSYIEGLPNVAVEAQAAGIPVVASNVGGVSFAMVNGETGILVPPKDEEALVQAICRLLADDGLRSKMGIKGKTFVRYSFAVEDQVKSTLDLYETVAKKGKFMSNQ